MLSRGHGGWPFAICETGQQREFRYEAALQLQAQLKNVLSFPPRMKTSKSHPSFTGSLTSVDLQNHVLVSYFWMRIGSGILGVTLPFVLWIGGRISGICRQDSISAYFWATTADGTFLRTWFVGALFAVSVILGFYRGFSKVEDILLDAAAVLGVGVTLFPMPWPPDHLPWCKSVLADLSTHPGITFFGGRVPLHDVCAVSFFICTAFICWFCADDTLTLIKQPWLRSLYKRIYRFIAIAMPGSAIVALWISWIKTFGVVAFGVYWLVKGIELRMSAADDLAVRGKLRLVEGQIQHVAGEGS
jgi:hypothetical protein